MWLIASCSAATARAHMRERSPAHCNVHASMQCCCVRCHMGVLSASRPCAAARMRLVDWPPSSPPTRGAGWERGGCMARAALAAAALAHAKAVQGPCG